MLTLTLVKCFEKMLTHEHTGSTHYGKQLGSKGEEVEDLEKEKEEKVLDWTLQSGWTYVSGQL